MHDMTVPVYEYDPHGTAEGLEQAAASLVARGARGLHVLGTVTSLATDDARASFDAALRSLAVPVFGGFFPRIVAGARAGDGGAGACRDAGHRGLLLRRGARPFGPRLRPCAPSRQHPGRLRRRHGARGGARVRPLRRARRWGGAGSLDFVRRPVIVTPQGLRDGVAVVAGLSCRAAVGVTHGWDHLCARRVRRGQGARASELGGSEHGLFVAVRHPHRGVGLHVARTAKPPIGGGGALTIGELASSQGAFVRVHNKTTVLALLSAPTAG